ncbi:MAG: TIGR04283 family arsenosugar biosynthesis glycosyltransferase [Actinomycetota bacterium]
MPTALPSKISIIIPTLNEAATITQTIDTAQSAVGIEVIVVDGGSQDGTLQAATGIRAISAPPGRAKQMNVGAAAATGDILLFLHADTALPIGFDTWVREILAQPGTVAGAFQLKINAAGLSLRVVETMANWRSHFLQLPYGDQAIFLKATTFREVGGFPDLPIMEDFELMRRLQRWGRIATAPVSVLTSARRWQKLGVLKTTLMNQMVILAYFLGVPPTQIAAWYRGGKIDPR